MRERADTTYKSLNDLARQENAKREYIENKSGTKRYYFVPWVGFGLAIADTVSKNKAEGELKTLTQTYENTFNNASDQLRSTIVFRGMLTAAESANETRH